MDCRANQTGLDTEKPTGLNFISQSCWIHECSDVKVLTKPVLWHCIGVHDDDILKADTGCMVGTKLQSLRNLTFIDAIEQMAVMDKEAGAVVSDLAFAMMEPSLTQNLRRLTIQSGTKSMAR